jgi:hypothetical protein
MSVTRHFLGWDRPVLPAAAEWLWREVGPAMGGWMIAVPTRRAGRRLLELLAERGAEGGRAFEPPTIETAGSLPECLCTFAEEPADELSATAARAAALRAAEGGVLRRVVPYPPEPGDAVGWWRLAQTLAGVSRELAAGRLTPAGVLEIVDRQHLDLGLSEPRWRALAALEQDYRQMLGRPDRDAARQRAIVEGTGCGGLSLVLVGLVDQSPQLAGLLDLMDDLTVLVPAPEAHAAGFDRRGGLVADYWAEQPLPAAAVGFVDDPSAQVSAVVEAVAGFAAGGTAAAEDVVVGVGDEAGAEAIRRGLELAGAPARVAAGRAAARSGPVLLLQTLARFADGAKTEDLATLARHPDLSAWLGETRGWITRLDRHASHYLQAEVGRSWRGKAEDREALERLAGRIDELLPESGDRPWPDWAEPIAALLTTVYGERHLRRPADHRTLEALELIGQALRELSTLDPAAPATPRVGFEAAVSLLLDGLAGRPLPDPAERAAVELVGFLELPWDDAEHAVVTDLNEGLVPATRNADAFLPDGLRRSLGLADNDRRLARDKLLLSIAVHSRADCRLLACRRSAEGDPRLPSRLLLSGGEAQRRQRVADFFITPQDAPPPRPSPLRPGPVSRFLIPRPLLDQPPLTKLAATAFRVYLACPYRFYLAYVARLEAVDDRATEMDGRAFGTLAHDVLEQFGGSDAAAADEPRVIEEYLSQQLDETVRERYGRRPRTAVRVQVEQLRERLSHFADLQAQETQKGWRIRRDLVEQKQGVTIEVDGEPFTITGTIDRIDEHPEHGYRVLDYKTADSAQTPKQTHRRGEDWTDLQLPLYRGLVAPWGIDTPRLGYVNLSKAGVKLELADWDEDELAAADAMRDEVIRRVRAQEFWPPSKNPPVYEDAFTRLAADRALNRDELIGETP